MHDIRAIREDPAAFDAAMARRGVAPLADAVIELDAARRGALTKLQERQSHRNVIARKVAEGRRSGIDTAVLETEASVTKDDMADLERLSAEREQDVTSRLEAVPNILDASVPDGADETGNVVLKQSPKPEIGLAKEHDELGPALGQMDFAAAARIAGSRSTVLRGPLARLHRALGQFMLDLHTAEHGYEEITVPLLVNDAAMYGTGQLPKFAGDLFRTTDGRWLIPTAEVPLTNLVANEIIPAARLPIRMAALTDCFRSEAGSAGRDTRGMLRQHQFQKVELVSITHPDDSDAEHERMTGCAEAVLERLGLPYRRVLLCSGDTGFGAAKTYDLEVWLPGQGAWREISSCSTMRAFQARRMNARFRAADGKTIQPVHTLNGSGVAVGRALIAVMEVYQQPDGSITVPEVLRGAMGGVAAITATG